MSPHYHALRHIKENQIFKKGDVLVLFGELFNRGYANGLVEEAEKLGLQIIRTTVGRRDKNNELRSLTLEEIESVPKPFINIPLEAGFDLEPSSKGKTPVDQLKDRKLSEWEKGNIDFDQIHESLEKGRLRFKKNVQNYLKELESHIPATANVIFAHLMAGGVPRAKIIMPLMNRSFKGMNERHLSSETFWNSEIGQMCAMSFSEVTAKTFDILIEESSSLRKKIQDRGNKVSYTAYGYHGTEVLFGHNYIWQTYTPYLQGWAKIQLENFSREWSKKGVTCCVYNCPEILTNSSSIFQGVEVSLYPLLGALKKEAPQSKKVSDFLSHCESLLKSEFSVQSVLSYTEKYLSSPLIRNFCEFEKWPQHNSLEQMNLMLQSSDELIQMHKDEKNLLTTVLSEVVFEACGKAMISDCAHPEAPVSWINHDLIAKLAN